MELWFSDYHTEDVKLDIKIEKQLFGADTDFQRIDVFESKEFGRFISCDGTIVFSEKDEFVYDEMIVHVPMAVHPHVRKVLVIGGGDGGVARELTHYDEIEEIDVVETDHVFIDVCRDYFPDNAWKQWEHFRACFADHTPTEEVGAEMAAMDTARQERETADFAASCARAAKMVKAVGAAHVLCWWKRVGEAPDIV